MKRRIRPARIGDDHHVELLQGGVALFPALVQAIDAALHEVRLETYIFAFDAAGRRVAEALERAAQRGVQVYLTLDGVGTPGLPAEWRRRFDAAGVAWHVFLPLGGFGYLVPRRWRRLHRKLCVVDGHVAFCGGINVLDDFEDPYYGRLKEPRLDFAVRVTGQLVAEAHEVMARFWWRQSVASDMRERDFSAAWHALQAKLRQKLDERRSDGNTPVSEASRQPGRGVPAQLLLRDNLRNRRRIERAYLKAIGEARHEVIIANAYFLPGRRLRKALVLAARRGVHVRLLLQGRYEYFLQYHASRPVYGALLDAGIEIHEYAASFLHAKVAVVDSYWATVGSSNLDPLSLLLAREANVVVFDRPFAAALRERLVQAMASGGNLVDPAQFAGRSWRLRALEMLALGATRLALFLLGRRY